MRRTTTLLKNMQDLAFTAAERQELYLCYVLSYAEPIVSVYRQGEDPEDAFDALMLRGLLLVPDDLVLVYDVSRQPIVLGKIGQDPAVLETFDYPVYITQDGVALRALREDGTQGLVVDTITGGGSLQLRNALGLRSFRDNAAAIPTFKLDGQNGQLYGGGDAPTIVPLAGSGTGATTTVNWGNDTFMQVSITAGSGAALGPVARVTFATARASTVYSVWFQGDSINATANPYMYATTRLTTTFEVNTRFVMSNGVTYFYACFVAGLGA
jgi:hypothetical protein